MAVESLPSPISVVALVLILVGVAGLAGGVSRQGALLVVLVLLAVTSFVAGRMSRDYW